MCDLIIETPLGNLSLSRAIQRLNGGYACISAEGIEIPVTYFRVDLKPCLWRKNYSNSPWAIRVLKNGLKKKGRSFKKCVDLVWHMSSIAIKDLFFNQNKKSKGSRAYSF